MKKKIPVEPAPKPPEPDLVLDFIMAHPYIAIGIAAVPVVFFIIMGRWPIS